VSHFYLVMAVATLLVADTLARSRRVNKPQFNLNAFPAGASNMGTSGSEHFLTATTNGSFQNDFASTQPCVRLYGCRILGSTDIKPSHI